MFGGTFILKHYNHSLFREKIRSPKELGVFWVTFEDAGAASNLFRDCRDLRVPTSKGDVELRFEWSFRPPKSVSDAPSTTVPTPYMATTPATFPEPIPGASSSRFVAGGEWDRNGRPVSVKHRIPAPPSRVASNPIQPTAQQTLATSSAGAGPSGRPPKLYIPQTSFQSFFPSTTPISVGPDPLLSSGARTPSGTRKRTLNEAIGSEPPHEAAMSSPPTPPHSPGQSPHITGKELPENYSNQIPRHESVMMKLSTQQPESPARKKTRIDNASPKQLDNDGSDTPSTIEILEQAVADLELAQRKQKHLERDLDKMTQEAGDTAERIAILLKEREVIEFERGELRKMVNDKDAEITSVRQALEQLQAISTQDKSSIAQRNTEAGLLHSQIQTLTSRVASVDEQLRGIRSDLQAAREVTASENAKYVGVLSERDATRLELERAQDHVRRLEIELAAEKAEMKRVYDDRDLALSEANRLETEISEFGIQFSGLHDVLTVRENELDSERATSRDLSAKVSSLVDNLKELQITVDELRESSAEAESSHRAAILKITHAHTETLEHLHSSRKDLEASVFDLKSELRDRLGALNETSNQLAEAKREKIRAEGQITEFLQGIHSLAPHRFESPIPPNDPSSSSSTSPPGTGQPDYELVTSFVRDLLVKFDTANSRIHQLDDRLRDAHVKISDLESRNKDLDERLQCESISAKTRGDQLAIQSREIEALVMKKNALVETNIRLSSRLEDTQDEAESEREARFALEDAYMRLLMPSKTFGEAGTQTIVESQPQSSPTSPIPPVPLSATISNPVLNTPVDSSTISKGDLPTLLGNLLAHLRQTNARVQQTPVPPVQD